MTNVNFFKLKFLAISANIVRWNFFLQYYLKIRFSIIFIEKQYLNLENKIYNFLKLIFVSEQNSAHFSL